MEAQQKSETGASTPPAIVLRAATRVVLVLTLLFTAYALLPAGSETSWVKVLIFAVVAAALVLFIVREIRSILDSEHPYVRAAEVLATLLGFVVVFFSIVYLSMSHSNPQMFSAPLDHISALYFTVVVFSTVGFGDIVAKTDTARLVVTVQILLDFVFIGLVVRLITRAVQQSLSRG